MVKEGGEGTEAGCSQGGERSPSLEWKDDEREGDEQHRKAGWSHGPTGRQGGPWSHRKAGWSHGPMREADERADERGSAGDSMRCVPEEWLPAAASHGNSDPGERRG